MRTASEIVADYVTGTSFNRLPSDVVSATVRVVQDLIGCALGGVATPWAKAARSAAVAASGDSSEATWWGTGCRGSAWSAALVNGTAAHALDFDDDPGCCHIGAVVIPAALAAAEPAGTSSQDFLAAICAGYDIVPRISEAIDPDRLYSKGYHPTAVCGVFGAAVVVGKLLGLSATELADAMGIAGSFASGNMEFLSNGAMTKRLQAGKPAADGLLAALLAQKGFTGPHTALEGPYGVWRYTESCVPARFTSLLGERYAVREVMFKKHACCASMATAIDLILDLVIGAKLPMERISSIRAGVCPAAHGMIGVPYPSGSSPNTMLAGQMSFSFTAAAALIDGVVGARQYTVARRSDETILELSKRIDSYVHPRLESAPADDVTAFVDITLTDGEVLSRHKQTFHGHPSSPMSTEEMLQKFRVNAGECLNDDDVEELHEIIADLPNGRPLKHLYTLLSRATQTRPQPTY